ncbi:membrane integrity-associated transporter subunit PqiC [Nitrosomonas sp.]|uniref:PqiC family protein n=1 Tax=Nitrosomonas sp. TaxID=42353 RepID=UPI0025E62F3F|nr:ABC-type transport auxiliary lipoprotein family protein [Nitrosomonas sp.]
MKRTILTLASAITITSCTSTPVAINYYMLPAATQERNVVTKPVPSLLIEHIELSDYLTQPGLVLQTSPNKIHISKSNLWAERLNKALPKALQNSLHRQSDQHSFHLSQPAHTRKSDLRMRLRIDSFHPTTDGLVIASGRYQLTTAKAQDKPMVKYFYFERALNDDGYEAAVQEMNILIDLIAQDILSSMQ